MERQGQICQMIAPAVRQQIWGPVPIHPHHAHGGTPALRIWKCWRQMLVCSTINWDKQTQPEPQSMLSCVHYIQTIPCFGSFAASFAVFCRYLPHMCHQKVLSQAASALQVELAQRCLQVPQGANAMRHATSKIKVGCLV